MPVSGKTADAAFGNTATYHATPVAIQPAPSAFRPAVHSLAAALAAALLMLVHADRAYAQDAGSAESASRVQTLPEIRVSADAVPDTSAPYVGGQVARGARLGILGNTSIMKAPFNVTSYTAQMIRDQQSPTIADAVNKDPSIRFTGLSGGNIDNLYIRGFPIGEGNTGEIAFDGQYGVAPNYRVFTDYVERIEVIKGPAAMLYGMSPNSGVGGVINIVPKRAHRDLTSFTANYSSDSQIGGHADVSRRFGESRQWGIRINGSHQQGDTAVDKQSRKANIGALALDYQGSRLRASLDVIAQRERIDAPSRPFMLASGLKVPSAPSGQRNVTQAWEWTRGTDESALLKAEYDISDALTVFANAGGGWTQLSRLFGTTPQIINAQGDTSSTPAYFKFEVERSSFDTGLRGKFATGGLRHNATLQASVYSDRLDRASTSGTPVLSNIYDPVARPAQQLAAPGNVPRLSDNDLSGLALADTISASDDRVLLTLGLRHQRVKSRNFNQATGAISTSYDESATTPMVGLVVQPWQRMSLYANYIQGLSKGDVAPSTASNAGEVFAPYKTDQYEIGTKVDFGRFATTLSLFRIAKPSGQLANGVFAINGEQRNRGLELNMFGEVTNGVRLLGGVALIDGEITQSGNAAAVGKTATGVPKVQANLGVEWDLPWIPGLTLTGATIHTGKQYINQLNTASLPSWTKVDVGARYRTRIAGRATTFRANLFNALDRDYWSGVTSWGGFSQSAPRTVTLSATIDF